MALPTTAIPPNIAGASVEARLGMAIEATIPKVAPEAGSALKTKGLDLNTLLTGVKFPITSGSYEITISKMRTETAGILLGPINVGGMVWNVWQTRKER